MDSKSKHPIIIAGGGIAGLTAAYELSRHKQFSITLVEKDFIGGKCYIQSYQDHHEQHHGNFNISPYYYCFIHLMKETGIFNHLQHDQNNLLLKGEEDSLEINTRMKTKILSLVKEVTKIKAFVLNESVTHSDFSIFRNAMLHLLLLPQKHRKQYDDLSYSDYLNLDRHNPLITLLEKIGAANPSGAAATMCCQFMKQFMRIINPHRLPYTMNYFQNRNTDLIDPLKKILINKGVTFVKGRISEIEPKHKTLKINDHKEKFERLILAIELKGLLEVQTTAFQVEVPNINSQKHTFGYHILTNTLSKTSGIGQYFVFFKSNWSIIGKCLKQISDNFLYVFTISSANTVGNKVKKTAANCNNDELLKELLFHMKDLSSSNIIKHYPGSQCQPAQKIPYTFAQMPKDKLPNNALHYPGIYLAGNFTNTIQGMSTTEGACESAKRCAAQIYKEESLYYDKQRFEWDPFRDNSKILKVIRTLYYWYWSTIHKLIKKYT